MATLNAGAVAPAIRKPNFMVKVNGTPCPGFLAFDVTNNTHFAADTFSLVAALNALPAAMLNALIGDAQEATVEILADDTGQGSFTSLITGDVDAAEIDLPGMTLTVSGRDFSGRLIDTKTNTDYTGKTASRIVELIAAEHGLTANAADTSGYVGQTYGSGQLTVVTQEQSEWDLLVSLAQAIGYDLWVSGTTLNFQPPVDLGTTPYLLQWNEGNSSNFLRLRTTRTLPLGRPVTVNVSSWNQTQGAAISHGAQAAPSAGAVGGPPQIYNFSVANIVPADAMQLAQSNLEDITQHERTVVVELPADNSITPRTIFQLSGTNTSADQLYRVASIDRSLSFSYGYLMTLRLKNHSPQTVTVF